MAWMTLHYFSDVLLQWRELYAIVPQKTAADAAAPEKPMRGKCLYLLHGHDGNQSDWLRRSRIECYADALGLTVIMPSANNSFYTDMRHGDRFYTHIAQEVPAVAQELLHVSTRREDNFIAGLSMGGYGALKIALREEGRFRAAAGLSPVGDVRFLETLPAEYDAVFGAGQSVPPEDDLFSLTAQHASDAQKPSLFIAIGTEDFLYKGTARLRDQLQTLPYDFTWVEGPGAHNWDFWDCYIQKALAWMQAL